MAPARTMLGLWLLLAGAAAAGSTPTEQASTRRLTACSGDPCPLNVGCSHCRSKWGWCGITDAHCNEFSTWTCACEETTTEAGDETTTTEAGDATTTTTEAESDMTTTTAEEGDTTTTTDGSAWDGSGVMSMWEADADISKSKCGFYSSIFGGVANSPARNIYVDEFRYCANDDTLWAGTQCGRCYEVRAKKPNTAAANADVQPAEPIESKVVQIIDRNGQFGRAFDCNSAVFQELTGHSTDLFDIEWKPVDCDVKAGGKVLTIPASQIQVDMASHKLGSVVILFFNQVTSVASVKMTAFKRCGDPPNPITCYNQEVFDMKRQGEGAVWENPSLGDGVVKPISFEMTLLNGESRTFTQEDIVAEMGFDPFSDVWEPEETNSGRRLNILV